MRELGFDPTDWVYRPFVSYVNSATIERLVHPPCRQLLVTTVIEGSAFDKDDGKETLPRSGDPRSQSSSFIPFCIMRKPLAWHRETACEQRRKQFNEIRVHFFDSVLPQYRFAGTGAHRIPVENWATQIIWDIFGLEPLKNWLGKIMLFERLPSAMGSRRATPCSRSSLYDKRQTQSEVKDISRTLSFGAGVPSSVQEIEALQATLQKTEDEDEQLALEEDITGKILWLQRLATVANSEVTLDVPTRERIMLDARAGISKYELWLAARAAGQTVLSRDNYNYTVGTQETASSTSPEPPSTSIVQQTPDSGGGIV
ncbi:hypothetical protein BKA82DRAFT_4185150 [Pisolithus tinctorius]|nr:hypothetical protein BKA82DRAFT_4185150 [Pisolithus tinctorius]